MRKGEEVGSNGRDWEGSFVFPEPFWNGIYLAVALACFFCFPKRMMCKLGGIQHKKKTRHISFLFCDLYGVFQ